MQDLEELKAIIDKNQQIGEEIRKLAKYADDTARGLDMRRERTQDAEIRKNCAKHLGEIQKMS